MFDISVIPLQDEVNSYRVIAGLVFIPLLGCRLEFRHQHIVRLCVAVVAEELVWCV